MIAGPFCAGYGAAGRGPRRYTRGSPCPLSLVVSHPLESELEQLDQRVQRLIAAYHQARLEARRAQSERDRLLALNGELRRRIEAIVERVRALEPGAASPAEPGTASESTAERGRES